MSFISVIIATKDRHGDLSRAVASLLRQSLPPLEVIIVDATVGSAFERPKQTDIPITYVHPAPIGAAKQRNVGLDQMDVRADIVLFIDDDVVLEETYIETIAKAYDEDTDCHIGGITGLPLVDGNKRSDRVSSPSLVAVDSLYGCNMSFRRRAIDGIRFDENLSLYSWLEDWDFSQGVRRRYSLVRCNLACLYHYQTPNGRVSQRKFGFMQVANWYYVRHKHGVFSYRDFLYFAYTMATNLVGLYRPGYFQRFIGNIIGFSRVIILRQGLETIELIK